MGKRSIPHINVSDPNTRLILQSMKERIESIPDVTTVTGSPGTPGSAGVGVPVGGTPGQVLTKSSTANYDTAWTTVESAPTTTPYIETFTPTTNQTVFNITNTPIALTTHVLVNQAILQYGTDFTLSGTTITLQPTLGYSLASSDSVQILYNY